MTWMKIVLRFLRRRRLSVADMVARRQFRAWAKCDIKDIGRAYNAA